MLRDHVKQLAERPIPQAGRREYLILAGVLLLVLIVAARVLTLTAPAERATPALQPVAQPPAPVPTPPAPPKRETVQSASDVRAAKRAARRFLRGYLPYTYGQRSGRDLPASSPQLRKSLTATPPRVPPAVRRLTPRIAEPLLIDEEQPSVGVALTALVKDGQRSYPVGVVLERTDGRWRAVGIG